MEEFPLLQEVFNQESVRVNGATLLAINGGDSVDTIRTFMSEGGYSLPVLVDATVLTGKQVRVFQAYGISDVPATFFIDGEGIIRHIKISAFESADEIRASLDSIR